MDWQSIGFRLGPVLTLILGIGTALCLLTIYRMRRSALTTYFGYVREQSTRNARRLLFLSIVLFLLTAASGTLWVVSRQKPELLPTFVPPGTPTAIPSPTPRTPTATFTPTLTPTITPTPTRTPIPPDANLPPALLTPFPAGAVEPGDKAALVELVLAASESNNQPINPGATFPADTEHVYAFFTFDGMARNVPWIHVWYVQVDEQMAEYWSSIELWSYGSASGKTWRYVNVRPGKYELDVYIGHNLQQKIPFTVQGRE